MHCQSHSRKSVLFFCLITFFAISFSGTAQPSGRDMVKEKEYEAQLRATHPELLSTFQEGTRVMDAGNYPLTDSLYSSVHAKAPDFNPVTRRLGSVKFMLGQTEEGFRLMEQAVAQERSSATLITLAQALLSYEEKDPVKYAENMNRALTLLSEGKSMKGSDDFEYSYLMGQAYMQLNQKESFRQITRHLLNSYNDRVVTHYYAALLAANDADWVLAEDEILKAKAMGLPEETANNFLASDVHTNALIEKSKVFLIWIFVAWALGFVLLYVLGLILSNYTLAAIERDYKNKSTATKAPVLRSIYRFLINTAGMYYYVSLPVVMLLVLALVALVFYLFWIAGFFMIKIIAIVAIAGCITIYAMIRSLFLKVEQTDPGRALEEKDAPGLYALTREVASTMGTRPIDEIRITPETDLAVYETGNWREKLRDKGKRILIIGTGVLKDFKQGDFKAVLAHEYGHFSNRDTAGGAVALRVRNDMGKYYMALYHSGQAVGWNLAFQFIRLYDFIFRRISNGATRLQEVLADRVAAQTYGAQAFENGLTYVITRNIEFVKLAHVEIEEARKINRTFENLYELNSSNTTDIESEVKEAMSRKTTNDDTHPGPADRFRYIEGLGTGKEIDNDVYVRELFADWNALTDEMTRKIEESWKNA